MARSTGDRQSARGRSERGRERPRRQVDGRGRATSIVVAIVAVLVVGALLLAGVLLLVRGGDDVAADGGAAAADGGATAADRADDDAPAERADEAGQADRETAAGDPGDVTDQAGGAACPVPGADAPTPVAEPYDQQPTADLGGADTLTATVRTSCGDIVMALDAAAAPTTVENFVALAEDGYYAGVPFHRVIDGFMIQGGDPTGTGSGCVDEACATQLPGYSFADELGLAEQLVSDRGGYPRGAVAMANRGPDTNGSQFFVVQADPSYPLPPAYAVFGEVVEGMDVVDRIAAGPVEGERAVDPTVVLDVTVRRCAPDDDC